MDPVSIISAIVEGMSICASLIQYYQDVRGASDEMKKMLSRIEELDLLLAATKDLLSDPVLLDVHFNDTVSSYLEHFKQALQSLVKKAKKVFRTEPPTALKGKALGFKQKALYPLQKGTLGRLQDYADQCRDDLMWVLELCELSLTTKNVKAHDKIVAEIREICIAQQRLTEQNDQLHGVVADVKDIVTATAEGVSNVRAALAVFETVPTSMAAEAVKQKLKPADPSVDHKRVRDPPFLPDTGAWFLTDSRYIEWRDSQHDSKLAIYGKAGCCKTSLCSTVIEDLRTQDDGATTALIYFYIRFEDAAKQSYYSLLCSALAQLTRFTQVANIIRRCLDNSQPGGPTTDELELLFERAADIFKRVYLVVDALDECPLEDKRDELLGGLLRLADVPHVRCLTSSRPVPDIQFAMNEGGFVYCSLSVSDINKDIGRWLEVQLSRTEKKFPRDCRDLIRSTLLSKADGMFQWAICQFKLLNRMQGPRRSKIEAALQKLPKDLNDTYDRILDNIDESDRDEAITALRWLAFAERPLLLSELAETCIIDPKAKRMLDVNDRLTSNAIQSIISPLVVVTTVPLSTWYSLHNPEEAAATNAMQIDMPPERLEIQLAHFSVKEYLVSEHLRSCAWSMFYNSEGYANYLLAQSCMAYMLYQGATMDDDEAAKERETMGTPLWFYAVEHWNKHQRRAELSDCQPNSDDLQFVLLTSDQAKKAYNMPEVTSIHLASEFGLPLTCKALGNTDIDVVHDYDEMSTPLIAAVANGFDDTLEVLLDMGASIDQFAGSNGTALQTAAMKGSESMVKMLLGRGASVNLLAAGSYAGTALNAACEAGNTNVIKVLLDHGADIHIQTEIGRSALHAACSSRDVGVVQLLLDRGASIDGMSDELGLPLYEALRSECLDIVILLAQNGADISTRHSSLGTPLQYAILVSCTEPTIKYLLDHGADVNDVAGLVPHVLILALDHKESESLIELLLGRGADRNAMSKEGSTFRELVKKPQDVELVAVLADTQPEVDQEAGAEAEDISVLA